MKLKEYAIYRDEDLIYIGTAKECAEFLGIKERSFRYLTTPRYKRRLDRAKKPRSRRYVVCLD